MLVKCAFYHSAQDDFVFVFGMAADSYLSRIEVCEQKFDVTFYIAPILRVAAACRKS